MAGPKFKSVEFWDLQANPQTRRCDHPGCGEGGEYRAPKDRNRLREYFWFCLEHIREYNKAWNYYAGMSDQDVEHDVRRATTWNRPSWPMGMRGDQVGQARWTIKDDFGVFDAEQPKRAEKKRKLPPGPEAKAFETMGLEPPITMKELKQRYKELVKLHHPDANGGDKDAEERLKSINEAYTTLKRFLM